MVKLEDVARAYVVGESVVWALRPTHLEIAPDEFVVVLGPSGSGKTTLVNLIAGLDRPTQGRVVVGGVEISGLSADDLVAYRRNTAAVVFQSHNLVPGLTARENVELAAELVGRTAEVDLALGAVGLRARGEHFPHELSGGEQQRVAIARAWVKDANVLLADEPTGNLDVATGRGVLKLLEEVHARGRCVILVSHNAAIARMGTRVITMRGGMIDRDEPNPHRASSEEIDW